MILLIFLGSVLAYLFSSLICLEYNVRKVRSLGVHAIRIPFDVNNYVWVFSQPLVWKLLAYLPVSWGSYPDFVRFSHRNWHFLEKDSPAARFGSVWATVSPSGIHLYVADADSIQDICSRWRDFFRPVEMYRECPQFIIAPCWPRFCRSNWDIEMLSVYGPSVFTVRIPDWPRHRRAVAAPFNESIMKFVWNESLRHAQYVPSLYFVQSKLESGLPADHG